VTLSLARPTLQSIIEASGSDDVGDVSDLERALRDLICEDSLQAFCRVWATHGGADADGMLEQLLRDVSADEA
jgi:hypothetical protein